MDERSQVFRTCVHMQLTHKDSEQFCEAHASACK